MLRVFENGRVIVDSEIFPATVNNGRIFLTEEQALTLLYHPVEYFSTLVYYTIDGKETPYSLHCKYMHKILRNPNVRIVTDNLTIFELYSKMEEPKPVVEITEGVIAAT